MASFQKNLQKFFVYFFSCVSVLVVILGVQKVKQGDSLGLAPTPNGNDGSGTSDTPGFFSKIAGSPTTSGNSTQTISARGKGYQTPWGPLATSIKVKDGKIIAVEIPELPDSPPSIQAKAYLIDQVLRSGSANIQGVSGATITSRAFKASLESALTQARAQGAATTVAQGTTNGDTTSLSSGTDIGASIAATPGITAPATTRTASQGVTTSGSGNVSGTFTGNAYQTPWGNAVASVTFTNGKITAVAMPQVPNSPPSIQAKPYLIDQALAAGNANIQGVSGATYASLAFKSSLESAIAKASAQGTVATQATKSTGVPASTLTQTARPSIPRTFHDDDDWGREREQEWDND